MIHTFFDKEVLGNLDISLNKEYLLTNGQGAYSASTICGCNTRKYHGVLVVPQPQIDDNDHVLVSTIDEAVAYKEGNYKISTQKYPNTVYPEGYKHISNFFGNPVPMWIYNLEDCVLVKEMIMPENEHAILIRYTVMEATEEVRLNISPFLSFRNVDDLKKADLLTNKKIHAAGSGIKLRLYKEYSHVFIQTSHKSEFIVAPDWYYNVEYPQEQRRGYDYSEDLFVPGNFNVSLKKGDKFVMHIGLDECNPKTLSQRFSAMLKKMPSFTTEKDCLVNAAGQFIIQNDNLTRIKAGYYWFGTWGRDTFISLPGLTLFSGRIKEFKKVIDSYLPDLKKGLFPNVGTGKNARYNSVDASLWFVWAIQQYALFTDTTAQTWKKYGKYLADILDHYAQGTLNDIRMEPDGLIFAGHEGIALTWMDAIVNGVPVTPRTGKAVEINALWYNAICFCIEAAKLAKDIAFVEKWENYPDMIRQSFMTTFWDDDKQYLADCVNGDMADWAVRPNQVFAVSLPYSPVPDENKKSILDIVKNELLTPKGLRTLSPKDEQYKGMCEGDQETRDTAYHQGTVWPWLTGHFAEAYLKEYGYEGFQQVREICYGLDAMLEDQCLYTVSEIYYGDEPHKPVGAVAQAWSVAELIRATSLLEQATKQVEVSSMEPA